MKEYKEESATCLNRGKYNIEKWDACKNIYNLLKSGGKFIVTIPHPCF